MADTDHDLRPYQRAAVADVIRHWSAGRRRVLVCLPTGAGKTTVTAAVGAAVGARAPLAFVHTRTLLQQTRRRLGAGGWRVATIQATLRAGKLPAGPVPDLVFVDEAHHLGSRAWSRLLALLPAGVRVIGCTATPIRADGTALGRGGAGFDALVATAPYSLLLRHGWLAPCDVVRPQIEGPHAAAAAYLAHGGRRPGVLFAPSIERCNAAVTTLGAAGVRAAAITANTPSRLRRAAFAAFDSGELDLLASPMALSEGFDAPRAAVCVLDRTCVHDGVYLQTAGRVLRPFPGKRALLIDLHGASERHGHPLADRTYHLEGEPIRLEASTRPAAQRRPHAPHRTADRATAARPAAPRRAPPHRTELHPAAARLDDMVAGAARTVRGWLSALISG